MSCPICVTATGRAVRDALAAESIPICLLATAGPFLFLALATWCLQRLMTDSPPSDRAEARESE